LEIREAPLPYLERDEKKSRSGREGSERSHSVAIRGREKIRVDYNRGGGDAFGPEAAGKKKLGEASSFAILETVSALQKPNKTGPEGESASRDMGAYRERKLALGGGERDRRTPDLKRP